MLNKINAEAFYSFGLVPRVQELLGYVYPNQVHELVYHDYWDHLIPPCPWVFEDLGFIPPTLLGEAFAELSQVIRTNRMLGKTPWEYFLWFKTKTGASSNAWDVDQVKLEAWAAKVKQFWADYHDPYPKRR